jgi:hypothetical protein
MAGVSTWTRPYEDPIRVLTGGMAILGSGFFTVGAILMAISWRQVSVAEVVAFISFATVWLTFMWRLHRTALLVSESGVRLRWLLHTRTFAWAQIRAFETDRDILVPARLWIALSDGTRARTPVQRVQRLLFGSHVSDGGTWLRPQAYDRTLWILRRRLAAAHSRHAHPAGD